MPRATVAGGGAYLEKRQAQFAGLGVWLSCGKCGKHSSSLGSKKRPVWGRVHVCCLSKGGA
jgi:hypothetical protein